MQERSSRSHELQFQIDRLKDGGRYKEKYAESETQQLVQAIDIINELRQGIMDDATEEIAWRKLYHAARHLEKVLQRHLEAKQQ